MRAVGSRPADCHSMASANEPRIRWLRAEGPRGTGGWPLAAGASFAERFGGILLAPVMLGLLLGVVGLLAHGELGRRRVAAWDADWQATEPQWTRRH